MGEKQYDLVDMEYHHIVLEGSQYEVGRQLAEFLSKDPEILKGYFSDSVNLKRVGFADFESLWAFCEECCPGITDEIQGFADGLDISPQKLPFWNWTFAPSLGGECSQLAVLPPVTKDHHIYVGRSYEWTHTEEDLKLFTMRVKGKNNHIGFSCLLFGRHDGMNDKGLLVSMTGGGVFGVPFKRRGPMFWLTIRSLLDHCSSVENALEQLETQPVTGYFTFMLVDKNGEVALVEVADEKRSIKRITSNDSEPYAFSMNHFRQPDMQQINKLNCGIITHSRIREAIISKWCHTHAPKITKEDVRRLFAAEHPKGLCNHFYKDGFGTLWSMVFDVTDYSVDVCFSAPTHNEYQPFDLRSPVGIFEYPTIIPITKAKL
jgi:predicted choloylglycine hydrolase